LGITHVPTETWEEIGARTTWGKNGKMNEGGEERGAGKKKDSSHCSYDTRFPTETARKVAPNQVSKG